MSLSKMNELLQKAVEKAADHTLLDLVVTPSDGKAVPALIDHIKALGGQTKSNDAQAVYCQLPAKKVIELAGSALVSALRPERLHRMH